MAYQIIDDGASIRFVTDTGELLVMKRDVTQISVVRDDVIGIKVTGSFRDVFFRYADVTSPTTTSAVSLRDAINTMVGSAT